MLSQKIFQNKRQAQVISNNMESGVVQISFKLIWLITIKSNQKLSIGFNYIQSKYTAPPVKDHSSLQKVIMFESPSNANFLF